MKPTKLSLAIVLLLSLSFVNCNKSSDNKTKTKTELITQASWKFDNAKVSGVDISSLLDACQTDNLLTFSSNLTGVVDEGATKCNSNDPQTDPFTWNFATNETMLHVSTVFFTGGSSDFNIVTLNDTQLVLSQYATVSGSTQNVVVSFKH